ncbi:MAG: alpha-amylase family glycosyl hydrolase [Saprospiraceae bacterium]
MNFPDQRTLDHQTAEVLKTIIRAETPDGQVFLGRLSNAFETLLALYVEIYGQHPEGPVFWDKLVRILAHAHAERADDLKRRDMEKAGEEGWFLSNELAGMSLYVDRFCGKLLDLPGKLDYLSRLGINFLHLMPVFESPEGESDGGYAVSDFRKVDTRFGTLEDLIALRKAMQEKGMYLMLDIVLNHTSHRHAWAERARKGDEQYQGYFYMYPDRRIPDQFEPFMPDIFPESAPGSFTFDPESGKWVMTVFHTYQWDLNYTNPAVFCEMLDNILFYANLGVDLLRIDAPAFIWKTPGTTCQNLPQAHTLLRLIKQCVLVSAPGMALLGEAIVAPVEIMKYFGTGAFAAKECDFAYNATQMALQWDMLATGDTRVMLAAQHEILQKPLGTSWITYTRCHDDIGLGYDDNMIAQTGQDPYQHRKFLKEFYSGAIGYSPARGALFSFNPKTGDARISGSLAALCGLEKAQFDQDYQAIELAIQKIFLMQAHSFFLGGLPMLFYGDEVGYTNDYSYLQDPGKSYDNRWMHRPRIDWGKNSRITLTGTVEQRIFSGTQRLLGIRKSLPVVADRKNLTWMSPHNRHVAGYIRNLDEKRLFCVFNFSGYTTRLTWYAFKENGAVPARLFDHWSGQTFQVGLDHEYLDFPPYGFFILEPIV